MMGAKTAHTFGSIGTNFYPLHKTFDKKISSLRNPKNIALSRSCFLKIPRRKACRLDSGPGHHALRSFCVTAYQTIKIFGTLSAMDNAKKPNATFKKPDLAAIRRAVASSTAIETGQSSHVLEQKLKEPSKRHFPDIKLAD